MKKTNKIKIQSGKYYIQFFKGRAHPLGVSSLSDYTESDKKSPHIAITPLVEIDPNIEFGQKSKLSKKESIENFVKQEYMKLVNEGKMHFGPFGDLAQVTVNKKKLGKNKIILNYIGKSAFLKPGLAVDLCIFIKGKNRVGEDRFYSVNIIRKSEPHKGKPALIGGFTNVEGNIWDSSMYTVLHESLEESNLEIEVENKKQLRTEYNATEWGVTVHGFGKPINTKLYKTGTYATSKDEELANGTKRVYATTGHILYIDLGDEIVSEERLSKIFEAGSDAKEMKYFDITGVLKGDYSSLPEFGIKHHKTVFKDSIEKLREIM